jgi:YVTN family beta-propeller protein
MIFRRFSIVLCVAAATGLPVFPAAAQTAYISNERGNSVSVIDLASGAVTGTFDVGQRPRGILLSRDGKYLYN